MKDFFAALGISSLILFLVLAFFFCCCCGFTMFATVLSTPSYSDYYRVSPNAQPAIDSDSEYPTNSVITSAGGKLAGKYLTATLPAGWNAKETTATLKTQRSTLAGLVELQLIAPSQAVAFRLVGVDVATASVADRKCSKLFVMSDTSPALAQDKGKGKEIVEVSGPYHGFTLLDKKGRIAQDEVYWQDTSSIYTGFVPDCSNSRDLHSGLGIKGLYRYGDDSDYYRTVFNIKDLTTAEKYELLGILDSIELSARG